VESIIFGLIGIAIALLCVAAYNAHKARKAAQKAAEAAQKADEAWIRARIAERPKRALMGGLGAPVRPLSKSANHVSRGYVPSSTPVGRTQDSGMDPLMAGVIGYALAGGFSSNEAHASPATLDSCKPSAFDGGGGDFGGGGASSSYESDSSSSSSDSSSSYDSGSSDSGGGSSD
jgi:hypothetical protein